MGGLKARKASKKLAVRVKAYEDTIARDKGKIGAYKRPGSKKK
jgi:hypothetical protein